MEFLNMIPQPHKITFNSCVLKLSTQIILDTNCNDDDYFSAKLLKKELQENTGNCKGITKGDNVYLGAIYLKNKEQQKDLQGYTIEIDMEKAVVVGNSSVGLFYGVQTLRQIIRTNKLMLPCLVIEDSPSIANRGCYIDVTRGRVPTLDALKEMVDRLSFYKINQMQLYFEHTFAFVGFGEVYAGRGSLCAEEILELDEYANKHHIELVGSIATFGHLYEILQSNSFNEHCELDGYIPNDLAWFERVNHHTINVSSTKSHDFVLKMIDEFLPLLRSNKFNICCDETFDLGKGKSKEMSGEVGSGQLYLEYVIELANHLKLKGKQTMFWGDIIAKHPYLNEKLPKDIICLGWDYEAIPSDSAVKILSENNVNQYICPSVRSENRILNSYDLAVPNIINSVKIAKKYHAMGLLNTSWGDLGHTCHFESSFPLFILGADLSWNFDDNQNEETFFEALSKIEYSDLTGKLLSCVRKASVSQAEWLWHRYIYVINALDKNEEFVDMITFGGFFDEEKFLSDCEQGVITAGQMINELVNIQCLCPLIKKNYLGKIINSIEGIKVLQLTMLTFLKNDVEMSYETAETLETWLEEYCEIWRQDNKESELSCIIDYIRKGSKYLRKLQKTGIGLKR